MEKNKRWWKKNTLLAKLLRLHLGNLPPEPSVTPPKMLLLVRVQSHGVSINAGFCFGQQPLILGKYNCLFFGPWQIKNLNLNIHGETLYSITSQSKITGVHKNRVNKELKWTWSRIVLIMNFSLSLRRSADTEASNLIIHKWPWQFC